MNLRASELYGGKSGKDGGKGAKFGTFLGVFTPSVLKILGVTM